MVVKSLEWIEYIRANAEITRGRERLVNEIGLVININGSYFTTAMILPTMTREFVIGHLFAQGIINTTTDIEAITVKDKVADVTLSEINDRKQTTPKIHSDLIVNKEEVFNCVKTILKSEIFTETEAVHSAGLFRDGTEAICIAEDIGRHNALDKVIGYGLLNNTDFSRTLAASTGRQPSEMVLRCRRANIPIIATKGVPTTIAIEIAMEAGITIAGLVRGNTMIVYSNPARIE